ncbi:MAG: MmgE/PrpD family protein [Deltaproteobacteria bacterium]|nr:MmgE/PrpD family protein [Deltaproteobacteria bacterium]
MSVTAELARHLVRTSFDAFGPATLEGAKDRIVDTLGCVLAGKNASGCSGLAELVREAGGAPEATVLGFGCRVPAQAAALVNAVLARSYDYEPVGAFVDGKSVPAHISGTTVPTALAVAEKLGASGRELLTALVLGDDLAARLSAASLFDLDLGWDNTGTANAFGATAIAGKLLELDEAEMQNAFGIVLNQLGGTMLNIFEGTHCFKLPQGLAARAGIFSASLAKKGFTGPKNSLTGQHGYFARYCREYDLSVLTRDLGRTFCAGDTIKPYPCCRANHAAIDCTLALVRDHGVKAADVEEVIVGVRATAKEFAVGQEFRIGEVPQISASFSLQYAVATALLRGEVELSHFGEESIRSPEIEALVRRIRTVGSLPPERSLGAEVTIRTKEGREYRAAVEQPLGSDAFSPLTPSEKRKKFLRCATFTRDLDEAKAQAVFETLRGLENVACVAEVMDRIAGRGARRDRTG